MTQKANEKDASQLKRALSQAWKDIETLPIVEIGARNAGVLEYMQHWEDRATKAESQLDEVTKQRDDVIRDAERYRWLREQITDHSNMVKAQALFWHHTSRRQFDKALDAAMKEQA